MHVLSQLKIINKGKLKYIKLFYEEIYGNKICVKKTFQHGMIKMCYIFQVGKTS